jgi:hypothetical protein
MVIVDGEGFMFGGIIGVPLDSIKLFADAILKFEDLTPEDKPGEFTTASTTAT